jgi:hypothetical protein
MALTARQSAWKYMKQFVGACCVYFNDGANQRHIDRYTTLLSVMLAW